MSRVGITLVLGGVALGVAAGCGHVETHQAMLRPPQSRPAKAVELYMADQGLPTRPFYEVAIVQSVGFGAKSGAEDLADALTKRAAALGCDAVVRTNIDLGYSRGHAAGVCVRFMADGPAAPPPRFPERSPGVKTPPGVPAPLAPRWEPLPSSPPSQGGGR